MTASFHEHWPPEAPHPQSRDVLDQDLLVATEKYVVRKKLDRQKLVGRTSSLGLIFRLHWPLEPGDRAMFHGLLADGGPRAVMLNEEQSTEVLCNLHPADRLCALQVLAWNYVADLFKRRHPFEEGLADDERVLAIFDEQQSRMQPVLRMIERGITDDAMSRFIEKHYTAT